MAHSPAKAHRSRVLAAREANQRAAGELRTGGTEFERHMMVLQNHRMRLSQIQSDENKAVFKREALLEYSDYLDGVLEADAGGQDEVVTTVMVWAIDAGQYEPALILAGYVLRHDLVMPDRFKRTTGCLIAEELAEAALKAQSVGSEFDATVIDRAIELTTEQDMPNEVRAKLHLAAGRAVLRSATEDAPPEVEVLVACVGNLKRAIELHPACGGKKDLERAERLLKKQTAAATAAAAPSDATNAAADSSQPAKSAQDNAGG